MEKNRKFYRIRELEKAYVDYNEYQLDRVEHLTTAALFGIITLCTAWMPLLLKTNPDLSLADKVKCLIFGFGIPSICAPIAISNLVKSNESKKKVDAADEILTAGLNDSRNITVKELNERTYEKREDYEETKYPSLNRKKRK